MADPQARWPGQAVDDDGKDLIAPAKDFLAAVDLLKPPEFRKGDSAVGIIESATLSATNGAQTLIKWVGGLAALGGPIGAGFSAAQDQTALAIAIVGSAAATLSALAIALAMVLNGDVRGRAAVTTEQVKARGYVLSRYLESLSPKDGTARADSTDRRVETLFAAALAAYGDRLRITTKEKKSGPVEGLEWHPDSGFRVQIDKDRVSLTEIQSFETT